MAAKKKISSLAIKSSSAYLKLNQIDYLGSGAYQCQVEVLSNGFQCDRPFGFDNDEYFLAKASEVVESQTGEAELMDLQADSFIRIRPFEDDTVLVSGYIVEDTHVTQSIEFAFNAPLKEVKKFVSAFEKMVRANV